MMAQVSDSKPIYVPDQENAEASQLAKFIHFCEAKTGERFNEYVEFEKFAVRESRVFWSLFFAWCAIPYEGSPCPAFDGDTCERATFFPNIHINYAEVVLRAAQGSEQPALTAYHTYRPNEHLTRSELYRRVTRLASFLRRIGIGENDCVVAVARNGSEAIVAALAAAAVGALYASCSPDMGAYAILRRFTPLRPRVLMANFQKEVWDVGVPIASRVAEVAAELTSVIQIIALDDGELPTEINLPVEQYSKLIISSGDQAFQWKRFPFNHPLFIMFSSGTTGAPKCIIHGAGGTLLEHLKEHRLHCDLGPTDKLFFQTTCAWMMWNWQLSALATGAEIMVFDGMVRAPETLWQIVSEERATVFGTSPAYLQLCETAAFSPKDVFDLKQMRSILSTGSILFDHQYEWVSNHVKAVPLQSICGGTDIIGCFVLGNPLLPIYRGEAQCRSLALDVRSLAPPADPTARRGELVCANPFPSRPLGFHADENGKRFHDAYFAQNPPFWTHGDLIEFSQHGGARLHGRSDGVLNIKGIRVGPAEVYAILQCISEIVEAMAVEQEAWNEPGGSRLILLVVLRAGLTLNGMLSKQIRSILAARGSAALVPARIIQVRELPTTFNGKRSETAAREAVNGREPRNIEALLNPSAIADIRDAIADATTLGEIQKGSNNARPKEVAVETSEQLQAEIARIYEQVIGVASEPSENYLEAGADSLQMLTLLIEIEKLVGTELPLDALFLAPTIEGLSQCLWKQIQAESDEPSPDRPHVRPAQADDIRSICSLLHKGFKNPMIGLDDWCHLFAYEWTDAPPTLGFVLTIGGQIVGFIGTVHSRRCLNGKWMSICNLTSWYVRPEYRGLGALLLKAATKTTDVSYTSFTPAPITRATLPSLGFKNFLVHKNFFLPFAHAKTIRNARPVLTFDRKRIREIIGDADRSILDDHARCDLLHVLVQEEAECSYLVVKRRPFSFRRLNRHIPASMRLFYSEILYCNAPDLLARHLERVKLAILRRQRTIALAAMENIIPFSHLSSWTAQKYYSCLWTDPDVGTLDTLYSEIVLLPL